MSIRRLRHRLSDLLRRLSIPFRSLFITLRHASAQGVKSAKALLREAAARTIDDLWTAIADAIGLFTPVECANLFLNSGYGPE